MSRSRPSITDVFTETYRTNAWGSQESVSGPGSTRARAEQFLPDLVRLLESLQTRSLLDAGCGDFNWALPLAQVVDRYIGVDVVPDVISDLERSVTWPSATFRCLDITADDLPTVDLILSRDCLVHLSNEDLRAAVRNFRASGSTYLLTTTFVALEDNHDIATGEWRPLNLERPPFDFPAPCALVDERCLHTGGAYRDKRLGLWKLDELDELDESQPRD